MEQYAVLFLGFPTWGMQLPPPVKSFLHQYDLKGKTVIPFNTNGGYGPGSSFQTVRELCPQSTILEGFAIRGGSERDGQYLVIKDARAEEASNEVETWLKKIGIAAAEKPPVVRVNTGEVQGVAVDGIVSYKGIPFAASPMGDLRCRPPQPAAQWTGVRQAAEFGGDCMQGRFGPPPAPGATPARGSQSSGATPALVAPAPAVPSGPAPSEDCLFVNVWAPATAAPGAKLPVMFWIYGGGFVGGSSASPALRERSSPNMAWCSSLPITGWADSGSSRSQR